MSAPYSTSSERLVPRSNHQDRWIDFVRWALAQLDLEPTTDGDLTTISLPEEDRKKFDGKDTLRLGPDAESIEPDSRFASWLLQKLQSGPAPASIRPVDQPTSVNDLVSRVFSAYRVDGGQVHLGGCRLEDMPFLRITYPTTDGTGRPAVCHFFVAHDGSSVSAEMVEKLGLREIEPVLDLPPRINDSSLTALESSGRRIAVQSCSSRSPDLQIVEPLATALIWIKHVSGKLQFTIGDSSVELPFSGWARLLEAPPYVSSKSGASTFHLAATDDGQIDATEEIVQCEHSGQRVLKQDLVECAVSGAKVLAEFTRVCSVTGRPVLEQHFQVCSVCGEEVAESAMKSGICLACRSLAKVRKDDPRLVWILSEHTGLGSWRSWRIAETDRIYIAEASHLLQRLLVVVDKESLKVKRMAKSLRLGSKWTTVPDSEYPEILN